MHDLFDAQRARCTDDADEAAFDGLCDVLEQVCGWHAHGDQGGEALFGANSLPQAQARAREWADARLQAQRDR